MITSLNPLSKLVIGTAQYGMNYGLANKTGKVTDYEMKKILDLASKNNIKTIDTAINYGDCEQRLGELSINNFDIISKISNLQDIRENLKIFTAKTIEKSVKNLKISNLNTLLLHSTNDLLLEKKHEVYEAIWNCKNIGLCEKIGISAYNVKEVREIIKYFDIDVVQFPFSVFNTQLLESGLLFELKAKNIEVHVRSIFLQGLLLMNKLEINPYFQTWSNLFENWENWLIQNDISKIAACLLFAFNEQQIDKYIVGIDTYDQLKEIINILRFQNSQNIPFEFSSSDEKLVNPSMWNLTNN